MADSDNRDFQAKVTVDAKDAIDTLKDVEKAANGVTDALDKTNKTVKKTNASLDGINDTSEEFSSIGEDLKSFQDSFQKIGSEISSELKSINTELKSFKQSFADFANSAKQPLQEVAKSEGEVAEQSGKTSEQTAELTDQMSRLDSVVADFRDKLDKSTEAFGKYAVQSGSANRNTEKLIDTVRVAQSDIADAYYSMYTQLSDIAGADWDTKDVFKNLVAQTQDAKVEFGKLYIYYDNLLEHLRNGGDGATLESLKQIKQDTRDVGDATKTAGQDTREGLDDIKDGVEQFSDDVSKYWNTMSDSENQQNQEMKKLWQESSHLFDSITWSKVTQEANNYNDSLSDSVHRSEALKSMMDAISAEPGAETDYAYDLQKQLEKDLTSLSKYYNKEQELAQSNNIKENAKQWLDVEKNIETVEADIQRILGEMDTVVEKGGTLAFNIDESSISQIAQYLELDNQHMEHLSYQTSTVNSDFAQLALELKRLISDTNSFYKGWESTGTYWTGELSDIEARFINVKNAISQLVMTEIPTDEYTQLGNEIEKLEGKLEMLKKVQSSVANNPDMDSRVQYKYWDALQKMINETVTELLTAKDRMSDMENNGNAYQVAVDYNDIKKMNSELDESKKKLDEVSGSGSSMFGSLSSLLGGIGGAVFSVVSAIGSGIGSIFSKLGSIAKSILKELVSLATSVAKSIWNAFKKVVSIIADATKNLVSMVSKPILNGVKSLAKWIGEAGLSLAGFSVEAINGEGLIKKLTNAVDEFMGFFKRQTIRSAVRYILNDIETVLVNIAKIDDEFNETMSNLIDSAKALGAQIVAIVEPIINAIGPYLIQIMDWLTGVADAAAQFVARITGNDTYVKAEKGQSDYASSLDDTTKSTQKATKATKEFQNTVLAFDQLNKLDDVSSTVADEDEESLLGISDADVKKAQTQATAVNDIADDIYKAFENKDWYEVGKNAARAINEIFEALDEWLGWDYNADRFTEWMQGIIDCVHGFIEGLDWQKIGTEIGDILNSVIYLFGQITDPVNGINFRQIGRDLGTLLEAAIDKIDWEQLGKDIIQGMQSAVNFVVGLLEGDVGGKLGAKLAEGISGMASAIDPDVWAELIIQLFTNFFDFFIELFSNPEDFATIGYKIGAGIAEAINGIDMGKVETAVNNAFASLTALFNNFISGLEENLNLEEGETIWTKLGSWFMEGIQWVMDWLTKNLLNGDTGAKVGAAISDIFAGIVDSFNSDTWADFFNGIGEFIGNMLIEVFGDTEKFKEAGAKIADTLIKILNGSEDETKEDAESGSLGEGIKGVWDAIVAVLAGAIGEDGENVETIVQSIKTMFDNIWKALDSDEFKAEMDQLAKIFDAIIKGAFGETDNDEDTMTFLAHKLAELFGNALDFFWEAYAPQWLKDIVDLIEGVTGTVDEALDTQGYNQALNTAAQLDLMAGNTGEEYDSYTQRLKRDWGKDSDELEEEAEKDGKKVSDAIDKSTDDVSDSLDTGLDRIDKTYEWKTGEAQQYVDQQMLSKSLSEDAESTKNAAAEYEDANQELGKSLDNISTTTRSKTEITAQFLKMNSLGSAVSDEAESVKNASAEYDSAIDNTVDTIDNGANAVDESSDMVFGILDEDTNTFMTDDSLANAAYEYFEAIADVMIDGFDNVITITADGWGQITTTIADGASSFLNNTTADTAIEEFFNRLNRMIEVMFEQTMREVSSGISGINLKLENVGVGIAMVPQLASGGRLDDGQLFIANENGPELVGTYGSTTGVMNNEQIVQAVTDGVRTAVTEAWNNTNQDSGDIVLYIDSEEIARASTKGNRSIQKRTNPVVSFA